MPSTKAMSASEVDEAVLKEIAGLCHVFMEDVEDVYACTPLQLGIMAQPDERTYKNILVLSLAASLDLDRLCPALRQVVSLNAALRTRIVDCELGLVQVVISDSFNYCTERPSESLEQWLEYENSSPMHLGTSLFRTAIVGRKLVMTVHHAISDGWTHHAMLSDVLRIYHGEAPEPHAEFKLFVNHCLSIDETTAKSFWSSKFSGQPAIYPLVEPGYSPDATSKLGKQITQKAGASLSPALIPSYVEAAWALTVMSYTKAESVAFGFVLSGRIPQLGVLQSTLGPTIVSIPVQVNFNPKSTIGDLVKERARERRAVLTSPALQYGIPKIRSVSEAAKISGGFSTLLNVRSPTEGFTYSKDTKFEFEYDAHGPICLGLVCVLNPTGISVEATFDSKVICERQMSRVFNQFEHILQLLIQSPATTKLEQLQLLGAHDRRELLDWNKTIPETPQQCLHELFSAQVRAQPAEMAIEGHDGTAAYIQLDDMSNRLVHELRRKGVTKEKAVALIFEKSLWAVVALLAVMKAGGICVPMDPAFPYAQKQGIISSSKADILLTSSIHFEHSAGLAPSILAVNAKSVSELPVTSQSLSDKDPPSQAAYVLFTSGSTGSPKGVLLEHRNLVSSLKVFGEHLGWKQGSRVLQFASYVWGASIIEMFGTLIFGGCVCIPSQEECESGLTSFIESKSVHSAILTPTVIRMISPEEAPSLRTLVTAGEPIDLESVKIWGSKVRFINGWGQSETAVCSALADAAPSSPYPRSIGRPVGCAIWIVDADDVNKLVPIGTTGELVIESPGVARGYLNDETKTAASFIRPPSWAPDQWSGFRKTHRMYRTGDLAKYTPNGSIHYIGRQDNQVKMRGQRFDLGEVESALCSCAIVRNAFATVQVSTDNKKDLVAVLSLADPQLPSETPLKEFHVSYENVVAQHLRSIRDYLVSKVPPYMVLTAWLVVERLPRTVSSKLDRRSIKEWLAQKDLSEARRATDSGTTGALTPPASDVERALQSTWSSVLSLPEREIGRESSFIRLGGDSIFAMQVATRCRKRGFRISVAALLRSESLADAATACEMLSGLSDEPSLNGAEEVSLFSLTASRSQLLDEYLLSIGVARANMESVYPCSPFQAGILFAQLKGIGREYWDRFTMKLTPRVAGGDVDVEKIAKAWRVLCKAQPMLRTVFTSCLSTTESAFHQIVLKQTNPSISFASVDSEAELFSSLEGFERLHFTAAEPPHHLHLTRVSHFVVYATIDINHALIDARSMRLIGQQLGQSYTDETSIAKAPDISEYIAWLQRQREPAQKYWADYLSGAQPCLIPTLSVEPKPQKGTVSHFDVPIQDARRLQSFCRYHGVTVANLMQAAWSIVLRQYNRAKSLSFGCLNSQQGSIERAETIVGPLLTMVVCKFDATPSTTVLSLLKRAKEDSLRALKHGSCSLSEIHEAIGLGSSSLFNTVMTIDRLWPDDVAGEGDIKVEPLTTEDNPTEYPIAVGVGYNNERIGSRLWYDASKISRSFVTQIGQTFGAVFSKIVQDPEQSIEALTAQLNKPSAIPSAQDVSEEVKRKAAGQCEIRTSQLEEIYLCSLLQQEQMAASVQRGEDCMDQYVFSVGHHVSITKLCEAWNAVVAATPALRTRIVSLGSDGTWQTTVKTKPSWDEEESLDEYLQWDKGILVRYGGPLCRFGKVVESSGKRYIVLSLNRAIYDDWTLRLVQDAVEKAYYGESLANFRSFSEFIRYLSGRSLNDARDFWRARLEGARDTSTFPYTPSDAPKANLPTSRTLNISTPNTAGGVPISALLRAAWKLCLSRLTGESKVCFGAQVDGRDAPVEGIVSITGPVAAIVPCVIDLAKAGTGALLFQVSQAHATDVMPFLHTGMQRIRSVSKDAKTACAFQNVLVIKTNQSKDRPTGPKVFEPIRATFSMETSADVRLVTTCQVDSEKTSIEMRFDEQVISPEQIGIVLKQFEHAISQLTADTTAKLSELEPLSSYERTLFVEWNKTTPTAANAPVQDQIQGMVLKQPTAPAVCSWDYDLEYEQLEDLSDRFAAFLQIKDVQAETIVPFFFDKSAVAVVVMLGILKAGGALLPMDVKHPPERIAAILADSCASTVIVSSTLFDRTKIDNKVKVDMEFIRNLPVDGPRPVAVNLSDACYIVYTSGSTGKPKGIVVTHANFATSVAHQLPQLGLTAASRTLQFVNFIFDTAMYDVFMTLVAGGCVCMPSEAEWTYNIAGAIQRTHANFACITPSIATLLSTSEVPTLRTLALTGEPLSKDIVELWRHVRLINAYGPAETTIMSSSCDVTLGCGRNHLCIGHPAGCRYWVVDVSDYNKLVPIGCPGELLIQGPIVSRGYLRNPEMTKAAFIDPPAWIRSFESLDLSQRWYKTGDIVTQSADGSVIYQGRRDTQVKLRGQRIELGEIEHHLRHLSEPAWRLAVELIRPSNQERDSCLALFYTVDPPRTEMLSAAVPCELLPPLPRQVSVLRTSLTAAVPEYMMPQFYIRLNRLPFTSTGKTDRKALRDIGASLLPAQLKAYDPLSAGEEPHDSTTPPPANTKTLTDNEAALRRLWSDVLSLPLDSITATENFFSSGGNSIRAMRLVNAARKAGITLTVADVFKAPVLSDMAAVSRQLSSNGKTQSTPIKTSAFTPSIEQLAKRHSSIRVDNVESIAKTTDLQAWTLAVGGLDGKGFHNEAVLESKVGLDVGRLTRACETITRRHPVLRTVFLQQGAVLYQVVVKSLPASLVTVEGKATAPASSHERSYLPQFHLRSISDDGRICHELHLEIHHALYDAISLDVVFQHLRAAYMGQALSDGPHFHDWLSYVECLDKSASEEFWRRLLRQSSMTNLVPPRVPTSGSPVEDKMVIRVSIKSVETSYGMPSTLLQAAWALVLSHAKGSQDIVFGAVSANRNLPSPGVDQVPGPCLNFLPVRARLDPGLTLASLIQQLQDQATAAIPHHHIGFRSIIKNCTDWPSWTRFSSILVYQNHESLKRSIKFGDADCAFSGHGRAGDSADIWVIASPSSEELVIEMLYSRATIPEEQANWIARTLTTILELIPAKLEETIGRVPRLIDSVGFYIVKTGAPTPIPTDQVTKSDAPSERAQAIVSKAWEVNLLTRDQSNDTSMFSCGADLVTTMLLSQWYQQSGYNMNMQDIINHPSWLHQANLLDSRLEKLN